MTSGGWSSAGTAVADLAVSLKITSRSWTSTPTGENGIHKTRQPAQLSSRINVEYSGDTVMVPIPIDPSPGACTREDFAVTFRRPSRFPFRSVRTSAECTRHPHLHLFLSHCTDRQASHQGHRHRLSEADQRCEPARGYRTLPAPGRAWATASPAQEGPSPSINTSTNQLGKIEDVVMSDVAQFHVVNPQLEIQPGQTAILSVQFSPQVLGTAPGYGKIISDDFAVDTALMLYEGEGTLGLDYFTLDDAPTSTATDSPGRSTTGHRRRDRGGTNATVRFSSRTSSIRTSKPN